MANIRLIIAGVIIVGCFSILYPRFFHPIILKIFGMAPKVEKKHPAHPQHRTMPGSPGMPDPHMHIPDDMKRHMKPGGPHPGMRAAAEMNKQNTRGSGGRGGVMGMVLPVYAVGIIAYLVYTLVKVFNKKGNNEYGRKSDKMSPYSDRRRPSQGDGDEPSDLDQLRESSEKLSVLENLLSKADDKNITAAEMSELQKRLEDTERQMARILQAMQTVSTKIDKNVNPELQSTSGEKSEVDSKTENVTKSEEKDANSDSKEKSEDVQNSSDKDKTENDKTDDSDNKPKKSEDSEKDEGPDKVPEEDVVLLDKQTDKNEEESSVRHRKPHAENETS